MDQNARNSNRIGNYRNSRLRPVESEWEWQLRAACRGTDSAVFFAPAGESRRDRRRREIAAKTVCISCPVRKACLKHALAVRESHGVWGGLSETERQALRPVSA
ncbi:WhiB family transcriptional regulator [Rhodococcus zopfii]|uniref:WhiB family transcriptional regulator n=1 Tax=Rhodococcus zopfii TaxID=43772 RepID=UPI000AD24AB7|nr:WhiB family transcriptional regulator [Rhodococcus zopfii]